MNAEPVNTRKTPTAVWAITPNGAKLARRIASKVSDTDVYLSENLPVNADISSIQFNRLSEVVTTCFHDYRQHIFIMATGIVVRVIAPLLRHKMNDPAVVVLDESGKWAISLVSGHLGGANRLAGDIARLIGATCAGYRCACHGGRSFNRKPGVYQNREHGLSHAKRCGVPRSRSADQGPDTRFIVVE